jgi:hypothetical protein
LIYSAFGLTVDAECELPELSPARSGAQIAIRVRDVPTHLRGGTVAGIAAVTRDEVLISIATLGRFLISGGSTIDIDPAGGRIDTQVRGFLYGAPIAALLYQRGITSLHAAAVRTPGGALLLAGHSRAGKSTLLAELMRRGGDMIADDMAVTYPGAAGAIDVAPGFPCTRLWANDVTRYSLESAVFERVSPALEKFIVRVDGRFAHAPVPLDRIVLLDRRGGSALGVERLDGTAKLAALRGHMHGTRLVRADAALAQRHFEQLGAIAARVPVHRITGQSDVRHVADLVQRECLPVS